MNDLIKDTRRMGDAVVVVVSGEVTYPHAPQFQKSLAACADGAGRLIIDLAQVPYIDSAGLGTLIAVFRQMHKRQGRFILAGLTGAVRSMFEITKVDELIPIVASVEEGLTA